MVVVNNNKMRVQEDLLLKESLHLQHLREVNHIKDIPKSNHSEVQPQRTNKQQQSMDQVQ